MEEPPSAPIRFDWQITAQQSLALRPELRKQRWLVKQRELELIANKNFLLPRLDDFHRRLRQELGAEVPAIVETDYGMRDFSLTDPWGHQLTFGQGVEK